MNRLVAALARGCLPGIVALLASSAMAAIAPQTIRDLAFGEGDDKIRAIGALSASGDPQALPLLQALLDGEMQTAGEEQVLLVQGDKATDLLTGRTVSPLPANRDDVVVNNRVRRSLGTAIAAAKLFAPDRSARLAAARELQNTADENMLPAITTALAKESDAEIKELLSQTQASIQLASTDRATRIAAIRTLAESSNPSTKTLLLGVLEQKAGSYVEPDAEVRSNSDKRRWIAARAGTAESWAIVCSCCSLTQARKAGVFSSIQR